MIKWLQDDMLQHIDKNIVDIIKTLNDKNYRTYQCCEGHIEQIKNESERWRSYISFVHDYDFKPNIPMFNIKNEKHIMNDLNQYSYIDNNTIYWYGKSGNTFAEKQVEKNNWIKEMKDWANSLPLRAIHRDYIYTVTAIKDSDKMRRTFFVSFDSNEGQLDAYNKAKNTKGYSNVEMKRVCRDEY